MLFPSWGADSELSDPGAVSLKCIRQFLPGLFIFNTRDDPGLNSRTLFHDRTKILYTKSSIMLGQSQILQVDQRCFPNHNWTLIPILVVGHPTGKCRSTDNLRVQDKRLDRLGAIEEEDFGNAVSDMSLMGGGKGQVLEPMKTGNGACDHS